jgi:hypothetical protein
MNSTHLSSWEQEEFLLAPDPEAGQHLAQCAACRAGVEQLQQGVALFRTTALEWTKTMDAAPGISTPAPANHLMPALRWGLAALLLLCTLLPIARMLMRKPVSGAASAAAPSLSDDALLQQIDQQVSEEVPDSMESLTHLVSTTATGKATDTNAGSADHVQNN